MKAHIGVDTRTGITHSFTTTAANEHDLKQAGSLLHGEEGFIFYDAGCRGAEKRSELQEVRAYWHIAEQPGKVRELKKHPIANKVKIRAEYSFRIIKCQFCFVKAQYRGLRKTTVS